MTATLAIGVGFSPMLALVVLCMGGATSILPITAGGAVVGIGTTAGVLFRIGPAYWVCASTTSSGRGRMKAAQRSRTLRRGVSGGSAAS